MSAINVFVPNDYYITKLQGAEKTHTSVNPFPTCGRNYHDMLHLIHSQLRYILQIMHVCKCIIQI